MLFILVLVPFNSAYRSTVRGAATLSAGQAGHAAPQIVEQLVKDDLSLAELSQSAEFIALRIRTIDSPAIIMQRTPSEIPFSNPAELIASPVADMIPRALWPGKPILDEGYVVGQEYFDLPPQIYTSTAVTPEGDLYRHGGWLTLLVGMFLFGCLLRVIDEIADLRRGAHGALLLVLLLPDIVQSAVDVSTLLAGIPTILLLWIGVVSFSFARKAPLTS